MMALQIGPHGLQENSFSHDSWITSQHWSDQKSSHLHMQAHHLPPLCSMSYWKTETMAISRQKKLSGQGCQRKLEER